MDITAESLHERYSTMSTEALADFYQEGELTELAVIALKDEITSRGLDWTKFITRKSAGPTSHAAWELWQSESKKGTGPTSLAAWELRKSESKKITEPTSHAAWELWKSESKNAADEVRRQPIPNNHSYHMLGTALLYIALGLAILLIVIGEAAQLWGLAIVMLFAILGEHVQKARNSVCPICRRWRAFKKTGETRSITRENSERQEEERLCKRCGHRDWVKVSESGGGGYVVSGDDDKGGGEDTCDSGGEDICAGGGE